MAILTKFLKLLKPERNDYVDVKKHLSENYDKIDTKMEELSNSNDEKLNKGAVSSEYDTAKKIEDKIKNIISNENKIKYQNLESGSDLNNIFTAGYYRSSYDGASIKNTPDSNTSAFILIVHKIQDNEQYGQQILYYYNSCDIYIREKHGTWGLWTKITTSKDINTLNDRISKKVSLAGDTMTGKLTFDLNKINSDQILIEKEGIIIFGTGYSDISKGTFFSNVVGDSRIWLFDDGNTSIDAKNLKTISKKVVEGINEVYDRNVGNIGMSEMRYIQDSGVKYRNWGYVDKITKKIYMCTPVDINADTVTETQVTNNFTEIGTIQLAEQNISAYYSFANNGRRASKNIVVNNESFKEINLTVKVKGTYYISANGWNLPEFIPDQSLNAINIYINDTAVAFAPSSSADSLPTGVNVIYECNADDTIKILASQTKNTQSISFSVFKI